MKRTLQLSRPIVFLDLETTGLSVSSDRIVEYCIIKLHPTGEKEIRTQRLNPGIPISEESTSIHGISDEMVKDQPLFKQVCEELAQYLKGCDFAGFNSNKFDIPLLMEEFYRNNIDFDIDAAHLIDVQNIFHKKEERTLKAAYRFYCQKDLENAHSAEADTMATMEVLMAQLERYPDLEATSQSLSEYSKRFNIVDFAGRLALNPQNQVVVNFGKYKDKALYDIFDTDPSYYSWIMKGDFPNYTKKKLKEYKEKWELEKLKSKFDSK